MASREDLVLKKLKEKVSFSIGQRIQYLRESRNLSQIDLASKMQGKFDTTNISRIESGRTNPTLLTLVRISNALEIDLQELFNYELDI